MEVVLTSCGREPAPPPPTAPAAGEAPTAAGKAPATAQPTSSPTSPPAPGTSTAEPQETEASQPEAPKPTPEPTAGQAYLSVARGSDPAAITMAALAAIGGIERFVKDGDDVIVKPNICADNYPFEYAATTNPQVVATLVRLCLGAGAGRVRVMDNPFGGSAQSAYARSGIADAVEAAGGEMEAMNLNKFEVTAIPQGIDIQEWPFYQEVLNADLVIDVPIAKHHSRTQLTLAGKNLMGVIQNRGQIHANLGQRIADLASIVRPRLTVVDAVRTLMNHGPTGGNLDDVRLTNTVIASHDIVAADAYAATLFDLTGAGISYVKAAAEMGLGTLDLDSIEIEEIQM